MAEQYNFTHEAGPVIPVSLFGDAASAGINAGNALPTPVTAGIQGAVKGYQTGQEIAKTADEITALEQQNQIRALQLDTAQKTHDLQVQDTLSQLQNDNAKVTDQINTRNRENDFTTTFQNATPDQQAQMVIGGQYQDVFNSNPKLFQSALQGVYLNPNNGLDPNTRNSIGTVLKKSTAADPWQKVALAHSEAFAQATNDLLNTDSPVGSVAGDIARKLNVVPTDVPGSVSLKESGKYQLNDAGTSLKKDYRGNFIPLPPDKQTQPTGKFDIVSKDGTILYPGADVKVAEGFRKYQNEVAFRQQYPVAAANKAVAPTPSQPQQQNQTTLQVQTNTSDQQVSPIDNAIKAKLQLDDKTFEAVKEPIQNIKNQAVAYAQGVTSANAVDAKAALDRTITATTRTITDAQYENSKALQNQYDEAAVTHYNDLRKNDFYQSFGHSSFASAKTGIGIPQETLDAFKVTSPKDLYFVTQRQALENQLTVLAYDIAQSVQNQIRAKAMAAEASKANAAILTALKNGANPG